MELSPASSAGPEEKLAAGTSPRRATATFTRNATINVGRLLISALVALVLPAYLTHQLPVKVYSAWALIMQMGAYIGYLDFGVQTGISKFVAEYEAKGDAIGASMRASAGLAVMAATSLLGIVLTLTLAWQVPRLFHAMPPALYRDVRISLILIGVSLSFSLLCSTFSAIFLGLQRYTVPVGVSLLNRLLFTGAVFVAVWHHGSLIVMGGLVAAVHIFTGVLQFAAWRLQVHHIRLHPLKVNREVLNSMLSHCSALAVWTLGMLCVSGLDVTIVGRYDFANTAFYSVATLPTNFLIAIMGAAVAPLVPAAAAYGVHHGPREMGELLTRATRYSTTFLVLSGLPLVVGGYWILKLWVGTTYALHAVGFLRILVLANIIRNLCLPYSNMLIAAGGQKIGILGAAAEAFVNVVASIYLAHRSGAVGVAIGTLLGSFVSVGMHFVFSMRFTSTLFSVSRLRLCLSGMLRPLCVALPSLLFVRLWWPVPAPRFSSSLAVLCALSSLLVAWFVALNHDDRKDLTALAMVKLHGVRVAKELVR